MSETLISSIGVFFTVIVIIALSQLILKREYFGQFLIYSMVFAIPLSLLSGALLIFCFIFLVIVSHMVFATPMEYFYYIYIIAMYQSVFLSISTLIIFLTAKEVREEFKLKKVIMQTFAIVLLSGSLIFFLFTFNQEESKDISAKEDMEWVELLEKELKPYNLDYNINSHMDLGKTREYTIQLKSFEGSDGPIIEAESVNYSVQVKLEKKLGIINKIKVEEKLKSIIDDIKTKNIIEKNMKQAIHSEKKYQNLVEKHAFKTGETGYGPILKELELQGITAYNNSIAWKTNTQGTAPVQYGTYFHLRMDFSKENESLNKSVKITAELFRNLGLNAIDFVVFSDINNRYKPIKICTMNIIEEEEMWNKNWDFKQVGTFELQKEIYSKDCLPMFVSEK